MIFRRSKSESDGLTLKIGGQRYRFNTPDEFEFALAGRTCVPAAKISALVNVRDHDLLEEAAAIKQAERGFADALSGVLANTRDINDVLKEVDLTLISQDNDWRRLISALMGMPASYGQYKKIALIKYMQYLVSRQEIIKGLHQHRQIHKETDESEIGTDVDEESNVRETAIFEMSEMASKSEGVEFGRLPKGETLEVSIEPDGVFTLLLAKHRCAIVNRDRLRFVDHRGQETILRRGKNVVGRDVAADIVIDAILRDISRKHLVIESDGTDVVRLTDLSSHGTWVDPRFLSSAGI